MLMKIVRKRPMDLVVRCVEQIFEQLLSGDQGSATMLIKVSIESLGKIDRNVWKHLDKTIKKL